MKTAKTEYAGADKGNALYAHEPGLPACLTSCSGREVIHKGSGRRHSRLTRVYCARQIINSIRIGGLKSERNSHPGALPRCIDSSYVSPTSDPAIIEG